MRWSSFGISSVVKPEPRGGKKKKTGSCRMSDALRGVMWSSASYSSSSANTITSLNILRFIWRCFTVAVVVMSLRAFYDCTLIVEALFYTESYFRIQYVLLYNKCIVWRKLNKCCLKMNVFSWDFVLNLKNNCTGMCCAPNPHCILIVFVLVYIFIIYTYVYC